jgi:hypothetical protein
MTQSPLGKESLAAGNFLFFASSKMHVRRGEWRAISPTRALYHWAFAIQGFKISCMGWSASNR